MPDLATGLDASPSRGPERALRGAREAMSYVRGAVRASEEDRPLSRNERWVLGALVLVPVLVNAILLLPELTIPVASLNDDMLHYLFVRGASDAVSSGQNPFDFWMTGLELGVPQFLFYQHLPHLAVVALNRLSLGNVDLLTSFNLIRYILMVTFPLTVWWSMRRMGFTPVAAAFAAAASSLLSGDFRYGFEYDSYTWRGFGLYTQLWGMHLSFITLACAYRLVHTGRGARSTAIAFALLMLSHLIYAYMLGLTLIVLFLVGIRRTNVVQRFVRLAFVGAIAAVLAAYMWLPFLSNAAYLNATPYLQPYKYDSFGAPAILGWLFNGDLFDHGRLPVLTLLFAVGLVAAVVWGGRIARTIALLFGIWLVVYFGRPTLGPIADLFPLHDGLLFHRFIGAVDLMAIMLMGIGGAVLWALIQAHATPRRLALAGAVAAALLAPAVLERADFYSLNTVWMQRSMTALTEDADAAAVLAKVESLPPGRVYAGLATGMGADMRFEDLSFYNLLYYRNVDGLPPPSESMSLNSDYIWDFDESNAADYNLFNARYVIAPTGRPVAPFLAPVLETPRYTLYEAPTSGYAMFGDVVARIPEPTQATLFQTNRDWFRGRTMPQLGEFYRYDYPAGTTPAGVSRSSGCRDPSGTVSDRAVSRGSYSVTTSCPTDATVIFKTTYHPNWQVTVDGVPAETFMVSPSLLAVTVPAGQHEVTATYHPTPIKLPLVVLGLLLLVALAAFGGRLDDAADAVAGAIQRRVPAFRVRRETKCLPDDGTTAG